MANQAAVCERWEVLTSTGHEAKDSLISTGAGIAVQCFKLVLTGRCLQNGDDAISAHVCACALV